MNESIMIGANSSVSVFVNSAFNNLNNLDVTMMVKIFAIIGFISVLKIIQSAIFNILDIIWYLIGFLRWAYFKLFKERDV